MKLIRATPDYPAWDAVRTLLASAFAYMEPRLGHPARAQQKGPEALAQEAEFGTVFLMLDNDRPVACLFCRPSRDHPHALYIGKLAVSGSYRGQSLARRLVQAAAEEARAKNLSALTLDTGDVFPVLHATFRRLGFGSPEPRSGEPGVVTMMRPL